MRCAELELKCSLNVWLISLSLIPAQILSDTTSICTWCCVTGSCCEADFGTGCGTVGFDVTGGTGRCDGTGGCGAGLD